MATLILACLWMFYTRCSLVADEEQKKVLGVFLKIILSSLVGDRNGFFYSLKGAHSKKGEKSWSCGCKICKKP